MTVRTDPRVAQSARRLLPVNRGDWVLGRTRAALRHGEVRLGAQAKADLELPALWEYGIDRARGRHVHGFTFLVDWVGAGQALDADESLQLAELIHLMFRAWDQQYGSSRETAPEMAFHDETTAQRLLGLVAALDELRFTPEQESYLRGLAERTATILAEPDFYGGVNNHGMFQDLALLTWSALVAPAGSELGAEAWDLAAQRLHTYFAACFTAEGVHVENTPTYHVMVARYLPLLEDLFTAAQSDEAELYDSLLRGAIDYAVHCVTPEGLFPPVSDTHRRRLDSDVNLETFAGGEFEFAATAGRVGAEPSKRTAVFPESGYAMTRSGWGDPLASYVHFTSSYNADYHKHSDEQSIYLRSGGRDLLCEAGPYGYNWKDPFTKYAYSSAAHNTMLVAGTGLPRTEPEEERLAASPPLNRMEISVAEDERLEATGTTRRYRGRVWSRHLDVRHGAAPSDTTLRIEDTVESSVGAADLRFLWHMGPGLRVDLRAQGAEVFDRGAKLMELEFRADAEYTLQLSEGIESPSTQGWHFPQFGQKVPAPVISLETHAENLTLETVVRLSDFVWDSPPENPFDALVLRNRTVPTWSSTTTGEPGSESVLMLSPYSSTADRERLVAELEKSGRRVRYVPGIEWMIGHAGSKAKAEAAVDKIARAAAGVIRNEASKGGGVTVVTIGGAFAPGALAALSTGASLFAVDPVLPFPSGDPRAERLEEKLSSLSSTPRSLPIEVLSSGDASAQQRALATIDKAPVARNDFDTAIAADVEDVAGDSIANLLDAREGTAVRYLAVYDRRAKEFVIRIPQLEEVEVSVRVFRGKDEVLTVPYRAGSEHRVPYADAVGPHRLRLHVRDPETTESTALTTGVLRVR